MKVARVAVFASGEGRSLENLVLQQQRRKLPFKVELVGVNKRSCGARRLAQTLGIRHFYRGKKASESRRQFSECYFRNCRRARIHLIVLAGFLSRLQIPEDFQRRVINIHPSLIPAFSGQGCYGQKVHKAVFDSGEKRTGCTVHYCDDDFDTGPIIAQRSLKIHEGNCAVEIGERVFALECQLLPEIVAEIAGKILGPD